MSRYYEQQLWEDEYDGLSPDYFDIVTPKNDIAPICQRCRGAFLRDANTPHDTGQIAHERYGRVPEACRMGNTGHTVHHCCPYAHP